MKFNSWSFFVATLSASMLFALACQQGIDYESQRSIASGNASGGGNAEQAVSDDALSEEEEAEEEEEGEEDAAVVAPDGAFTMAWTNPANPAIVGYKVFVLPPDNGSVGNNFANLSGVPIEIKNTPVAQLIEEGDVQKVFVTGAEINAGLTGLQIDPAAPLCFTLVAVNAVGNSVHTNKSCVEP